MDSAIHEGSSADTDEEIDTLESLLTEEGHSVKERWGAGTDTPFQRFTRTNDLTDVLVILQH